MPGIFISYRRQDSSGWSGRLARGLQQEFGDDLIFFDIESLTPGADYAQVIRETIDRSNAVVVVIGPKWLETIDATGRRRLEDPDDLNSIEIAHALERDVTVVPVLVGGAFMPVESALPARLRLLAKRHAFELSDKRWEYDESQLVKGLKRVVNETDRWTIRKPLALIILAIILCIAAIGSIGAWIYLPAYKLSNTRWIVTDADRALASEARGTVASTIVQQALSQVGTSENGTSAEKLRILSYWAAAGASWYKDRTPETLPTTPWGGAFLAWVVAQAGLKPPVTAANFASWLNWGEAEPDGNLRSGSIVAFPVDNLPESSSNLLVGIVLGKRNGCVDIIVGNLRDKVSITCVSGLPERVRMPPSEVDGDPPAQFPETDETRLSSFTMQTPPTEYKAGLRVWTRVAPDRWVERYPDATLQYSNVLARTRVGDCDGTIVGGRDAIGAQGFLPDKNCEVMRFLFRRLPSRTWIPYVPMDNVR